MTDILYRQTDSASFAPDLMAYSDLLTQMIDFSGAMIGDVSERNWRNAVALAMRRIVLQRDWKYYTSEKRFLCSADVSLTASYDHTGGAFERLVTVTSGSLPDWLNMGHIVIDGQFYEVEEYKSATTFTLTQRANPGEDVASSTITLGRALYPMPADYLKCLSVTIDQGIDMTQIDADQSAYWEKNFTGTGRPDVFAIIGNPRFFSTQFFKINPRSASGRIISMCYRRYARTLRFTGFDTNDTSGTITTGGTNSKEYATTSGSTVTAEMLGSLIRMRSDANIPEGLSGKYPYAEQRVIVKVDTGTNRLYFDRPTSQAYTAKAYCITDPVDLPPHVINAFIAACRVEYARQQPKEAREISSLENFFRMELTLALENESAYHGIGWQGPVIVDRMHVQN